jgi:PAS domain S-box-containing protein
MNAELVLDSIGDAVLCTDECCIITYLNPAAERLTDWRRHEAAGHPLLEVLHIVEGIVREGGGHPMAMAIRENKAMHLSPNCVLTRREGVGVVIEGSAAPIRDRLGRVTGAVMVFRALALGRAKAAGGNHFRVFQPDHTATACERKAVDHELRQAVKRGELLLHYQPQVNLATGEVSGVEALLRWRHARRGLLYPAQFMSAAEEFGAIVPIGEWVLRQCCRQARAWQDSGLPAVRMAINVSAEELRTKNYIDGVRAVLKETGLPPRHLELELTDGVLTQDSQPSAGVLEGLKDMGVQLAHDFGLGHAHPSYRPGLPIDTLKIDQSFVRNLTTDADDAGVVSAVINMGSSLHLAVVAEGVETSAQAALLRDRHCPEAQGFYFSQPVVAERIGVLLHRSSAAPRSSRAHN